MIGILIGIVGASGAILSWLALASYLYCLFSKHMALYTFPFVTQWLEISPFWADVNMWTRGYIIASAVLATLPFLAVGIIIIGRLRSSSRRPALYGKTGWASISEMLRGGIKLTKEPF